MHCVSYKKGITTKRVISTCLPAKELSSVRAGIKKGIGEDSNLDEGIKMASHPDLFCVFQLSVPVGLWINSPELILSFMRVSGEK